MHGELAAAAHQAGSFSGQHDWAGSLNNVSRLAQNMVCLLLAWCPQQSAQPAKCSFKFVELSSTSYSYFALTLLSCEVERLM